MPINQELVEFLKKEYHPHVIALSGSRANGTHAVNSDWDLFLFCDTKSVGGVSGWNGQELDITFHEWPKPEGWIFTNPYSPVWPIDVLFDDTDGAFDVVLNQTKEVYEKGPLVAYPEGCLERLHKLERWTGKLKKYQDNAEVRFYYAGFAYEAFIRVWFERRNLWPLPPARAIPFIKEIDHDFWVLLNRFVMANEKELFDISLCISEKISIEP